MLYRRPLVRGRLEVFENSSNMVQIVVPRMNYHILYQNTLQNIALTWAACLFSPLALTEQLWIKIMKTLIGVYICI